MTNQLPWQQVGGNAAEVYARYLAPAMFAPWVPALLDRAHVQPGEHVLDIACGTGVVTHAAAERVGSAGRVVGLDLNAAMLAMAQTDLPAEGAPIEWIEANALALPLPDAAFDLVLCQHGLQQFPDRPTALAEMRRVLQPGGRLVVSVWSRIERNPGMHALANALERHVGPEAANNRRAPFSLSDADELRELLLAARFSDVAVETCTEMAHFHSPERLVDYQLAATPLSTLGAIGDEVRQAVYRDVGEALRSYVRGDEFALAMEANVAFGRA